MRLLDTNIVIYATRAEHRWLRDWIQEEPYRVSSITRVEALGFRELSEMDKAAMDILFIAPVLIPVGLRIEERAIALKQQKRIGLGDSLIAATALVFDFELVTRNVRDFEWIEGLKVINPFNLGLGPGSLI